MEIHDLLEKSLEFCRNAAPDEAAPLEQLLVNAGRETFRICVAGGFSRGKSHFLNNLLGTPLLPESAIPATSLVTVIAHGEKPELLVVYPDREERLELSEENLARFSALEDGTGGAMLLKIFCPLPLLQSGIELVDTPGVDDAEMEGAKLTCEALLNCDAAIVMLSAISPLSLTEKEFVKVYLVERAMPLLACGISFLDQIPDKKRDEQLAFVIKRAKNLYPGMDVLLPEAIEDAPRGVVAGPSAIAQFLQKWQNLPRLDLLRQKMLTTQLVEILGAVLSSLKARKKLLDSDLQNAKKELASAIAALEPDSSFTLDLKMSFMERLDTLMEFIRKSIDNFTAGVLATDFDEEAFYTDFSKLYNDLTEHCALYLQKDVEKLDQALAERFGVPNNVASLGNVNFSQFPITRITPRTPAPELFLDTAINRGLDLGDLVAPRLPMGTILWPMLKPKIRELVDQLRGLLMGQNRENPGLQGEITANGVKMAKVLRAQLEDIYKKLFEEARNASRTWLEQQKKNLENIHDFSGLEKEQENCQQMLLTGYTLRDEAEKFLKNVEHSLN